MGFRLLPHGRMNLLPPPGPIRIPKQLTAAERDPKKHLKLCELALSPLRQDTIFSLNNIS